MPPKSGRKSQQANGARDPLTVDELLAAAADEDGRGERWLASDLPKASRAWEESRRLYAQAAELDERSAIDDLARVVVRAPMQPA